MDLISVCFNDEWVPAEVTFFMGDAVVAMLSPGVLYIFKEGDWGLLW